MTRSCLSLKRNRCSKPLWWSLVSWPKPMFLNNYWLLPPQWDITRSSGRTTRIIWATLWSPVDGYERKTQFWPFWGFFLHWHHCCLFSKRDMLQSRWDPSVLKRLKAALFLMASRRQLFWLKWEPWEYDPPLSLIYMLLPQHCSSFHHGEVNCEMLVT